MIEYLLPRALVSRTEATAQAQEAEAATASPFASAMATAFAHAKGHLHQAVWLSLPISLLGLLPSIFLLQVYNRVISRGGTATLTAMVAGVLCMLALELYLRRKRARALREAGATIDREVSQSLMRSMLGHPLLTLEQRSATQWLQLFRDVGAMRSCISGGVASSVLDLPMALLALIVIGIIALPVSSRRASWTGVRPRYAMHAARSRCWAMTQRPSRPGSPAMTAGWPRASRKTARWKTPRKPAMCC